MKTGQAEPTFSVHYDEGLKVGYKWYDAEKKAVLFPFGYGLSYTTFAYSGLKVTPGTETTVSFTVKNTGSRDGAEIAEVYAALPASAERTAKEVGGIQQSVVEGRGEQGSERERQRRNTCRFMMRRAVGGNWCRATIRLGGRIVAGIAAA